MGKTYFHRLNAETNNRMWINNPTLEEARLAIQAGAIACTSNPTFAAKMLTSQADGELARRFLREAMAEGGSDNEAALLLQRKLINRRGSGRSRTGPQRHRQDSRHQRRPGGHRRTHRPGRAHPGHRGDEHFPGPGHG